jgi:hypothetical protein
MFLRPPSRAVTQYVGGKFSRPVPFDPLVETKDFAKFVDMYRRVAERCGRTCENCGKPYLAAPHLALAILDPHGNKFSPRNVQMLCTTCNRKREAALGPTAAQITGLVLDKVYEREGSTCFYCDRGPLNGHLRTVVGRVDSPDVEDPNDWACSCRSCAKDRGAASHDRYVSVCTDRAFRLWSRLREET